MVPQNKEIADLGGIGKVAQAIPPEVYSKTAGTLLTTFKQLVAPITETTSGFGRYVRQRFDNMVLAEKALATYTLEKAIHRAKIKAERQSLRFGMPPHPKSFIKALEEASKETDPVMHEMWTNLLASSLVEGCCHPHFVESLSHFSPAEAKILVSLREVGEVGEHGGGYLMIFIDEIRYWVTHADDPQPKPWTVSCTLLTDWGFAELLGMKNPPNPPDKNTPTIMFRTIPGNAFLKAVSE